MLARPLTWLGEQSGLERTLAEILSWMEDLPRMEAHILDGGHFLLETHAGPAAVLMRDLIERTGRGAGS